MGRLKPIPNVFSSLRILHFLIFLNSFAISRKYLTGEKSTLSIIGDETLIECDRSLLPKVFKHLKMYKIRKQVTLEQEPADFKLGHLLGDIENEKQEYDYAENGEDLLFWDPRQLRFGKRTLDSNITVETASFDDYTNARYLMGLAEGANEIEFGKAFPLEHNIDHTSGISFHKGCYLGQELTARTFHTGVTRKRILPVSNLPDTAVIGDDLKNEKKRRAGKLIARNSLGNGLIMFRVENFDRKVTLGDSELVITQPDWWKRQDPQTLSFGICDDFRHADYESFSFNY